MLQMLGFIAVAGTIGAVGYGAYSFAIGKLRDVSRHQQLDLIEELKQELRIATTTDDNTRMAIAKDRLVRFFEHRKPASIGVEERWLDALKEFGFTDDMKRARTLHELNVEDEVLKKRASRARKSKPD